MTEVSNTRLYLGNLPIGVTKSQVEAHFKVHGTGEITKIKLMHGYGFIEYKDALDARDVVPDGSDFDGNRLTVQFARGSRANENFANHDRPPRPRRTQYRMQITGLPNDTSWQDLKDFARQSSLDVVYSETRRDAPGRGFVEFENEVDLKTAIEKLDGREFPPGNRVTCIVDTNPSTSMAVSTRSPDGMGSGSRRFQSQPDMRPDRSRSPRRPPHLPPPDDYDRRRGGPEQRPMRETRRDEYFDEYRARSPHYFEDRDRARYRSPRRGRYDDDPYRREYVPHLDPYANGRSYDRPPRDRDFQPRDFPPRDFQSRDFQPRDAGYHREYPPRGYDRGRYW